jgi:hypothetical protein
MRITTKDLVARCAKNRTEQKRKEKKRKEKKGRNSLANMWLCVHNQLKKTYAQSKETLEKVAGKSLT